MRKLYPAELGPLTDVPNTGCSPTLLRIDEWQRVTPVWESITAKVGQGPEGPCAGGAWVVVETAERRAGAPDAGPALVWPQRLTSSAHICHTVLCMCAICPAPQIEGDEEIKKALEWVREMYAFSVACALEKIPLDLKVRPCLSLTPLRG